MSKRPAGLGVARRPGWRAVTWMLLVAFTLQSFITETHFHAAPQAGASTVTAGENAHHQSPNRTDTTVCPFCQAIVHAGAFFAPSPPLLLLPALRVASALQGLVATAIHAPAAHGWLSRAPPQG